MSCAKDGGGIVGTGVLIPLIIPTLRRKFASMIRKARAYLQDIESGEFLLMDYRNTRTVRPLHPKEVEPIAPPVR